MDNNELKIEYDYFLEYLNKTYCILKDLNELFEEYLSGDIGFLDELTENERLLESNYFYLLDITLKLQKLIDEANEIDFCKKQMKRYTNNILILPLFPDEDIYVHPDENLLDFWKHNH
ncbi:TPA: hypothetical protein CPT87_11265 [Candidatus Gastranaerophilales bacterium HUM_5]|nr:MAG TPA: hypothetical protein CPT99_09070 [Candidatus Gastranaerophilales bacterium HUM_4]DAA88230.1 MAG TPA: hypothetical protein CPT87_11265 [Candidatus Gastranaerophilales bacterium HUM_5]